MYNMSRLILICQYCVIEKNSSEFNVEHVLPRSFGTFKQNLTLIDKVCISCNKMFGDKIEIALARNTLAGVRRYMTGIRKPNEFRPSMAKFLTVILDEQRLDKLQLKLAYSAKHDDIIATPVPVVDLKRKNGEMQRVFLDDLPDSRTLHNEFALSDKESIRVPEGVNLNKVIKALEQRNVIFNLQRYEEVKIGKTVNCIITENICVLTVRAIYKIAFNYLTKFNSTRTMLHKMFAPARAFILQGVCSEFIYCEFAYVPNEFINTLNNTHYHTMCVTLSDGYIWGHVYLHPSFRYMVILAKHDDSNEIKVNFGHMFDLNSKTIVPFDSYEPSNTHVNLVAEE